MFFQKSLIVSNPSNTILKEITELSIGSEWFDRVFTGFNDNAYAIINEMYPELNGCFSISPDRQMIYEWTKVAADAYDTWWLDYNTPGKTEEGFAHTEALEKEFMKLSSVPARGIMGVNFGKIDPSAISLYGEKNGVIIEEVNCPSADNLFRIAPVSKADRYSGMLINSTAFGGQSQERINEILGLLSKGFGNLNNGSILFTSVHQGVLNKLADYTIRPVKLQSMFSLGENEALTITW